VLFVLGWIELSWGHLASYPSETIHPLFVLSWFGLVLSFLVVSLLTSIFVFVFFVSFFIIALNFRFCVFLLFGFLLFLLASIFYFCFT